MPVENTDVGELLGRCDFPPPGTVVDVGVSGGSDSSALLALAVAAGCVATAVHVDHGLRPESIDEADAVERIARSVGASFRSVRVRVADGPNLEARAREARHAALGPDALLGHTLDDRAETILLHLLRGSGAAGFAALAPPDQRRPILGLRRAETVAVCRDLHLDTVDDPSNTDPRFTRNRVRNEVLPLLDDVSGRDSAVLITRAADLIAADGAVLDELAATLDPTDARELVSAPVPLASRALRAWLADAHEGYAPSSAEVDRVLGVARGDGAATDLVGGARVARTAQRLRLEPARWSEARAAGRGVSP